MPKPTTTWRALAAAGLLAALVAAPACGGAPAAPRIAFKHGEQRGRLAKNGLRFVVVPDRSTGLVEVDVRYEVGAREDPPGKAGLAHLVEHLMFQQRPDGPGTPSIMQYLTQSAIALNAYTTWDATHYMTSARADQLDALVKIEAMRMHYGCQTISEDEFLREREVVRNEIRARARTPAERIPALALAALYPPGHAYRQMVGGDDTQLATITLRDACEFMQRYYVPERATVIVAGGALADEAVASIQRWFGALERRAPAPRRAVAPVTLAHQTRTFELDVERPWVTAAWALPDARTPEGAAAEIGIWNAFFNTAARAERYECATRAMPAVIGGKEAPVFLIALELRSLDTLDECLEVVWSAARRARRGWDVGDGEEIEEVKNRRKAMFLASLEPLFGPGGRTDQLGDLVQFSPDFDFDSRELYVLHELERIGRFDFSAVGRVLARALDPARASVLVFKPSKAGLRGDPRARVTFATRAHERVEVPDVDPAEARRPLQVAAELGVLGLARRFELDNGMRVALLAVDGMPVVSAQLVFDVGDAAAPERPALAAAAAAFLSPPPGADALGRTGVELGCGSTPDHTICTARGMDVYLDVVIRGLERLVRAGVYPQDAIERWQKAIRAAHQRGRTRQQLELDRQRLAAVFGGDHPYTRTGVLTPEAAGQVGRDALVAFRDRHYSAANATLVIAGKFDEARAERLIREHFGRWTRGHRDEPVARDLAARAGPAYIGVIGDEDPQLDVSIHYPSAAGIDGQEAARLVLTGMLDDQMAQIRTRLGATYGTYASRDVRRGPSMYELGGAVDAPRAGEAIAAMRAGIDALRRGEGFDAAFVRARRKVIQQLLGESTVSAELAARLGRIARFGLRPDHYDQLLRQVAAVALAQVKALLATELAPAGEVIVTRGDRAAVTKAFADAGITGARIVEPPPP